MEFGFVVLRTDDKLVAGRFSQAKTKLWPQKIAGVILLSGSMMMVRSQKILIS
jgi:hypothetical protein